MTQLTPEARERILTTLELCVPNFGPTLLPGAEAFARVLLFVSEGREEAAKLVAEAIERGKMAKAAAANPASREQHNS